MADLRTGVHGAADVVAGLIDEAQRDHDRSFEVYPNATLALSTAAYGDLTRAESYLAWVERQPLEKPWWAAIVRSARVRMAAARCEIDAVTAAVSAFVARPSRNIEESMAAAGMGALFVGSMPLIVAVRDRIRLQEAHRPLPSRFLLGGSRRRSLGW